MPQSTPEPSSPSEDDLEVIVNEDGSIVFIHNDDLHDLLLSAFPQMETRRASHVEPDARGGWSVDASPLLGKSTIIANRNRRDDAIAAEIDWLKKHLEGANP